MTISEESRYDLVVIGGGPAGYAGAIRAGQLGKRVACVELERAGGTCLNWGCIPSKALLRAAELYESLNHAGEFGFSVEEVGVDFEKVMRRSRKVADRMGEGIEFLFKKNEVDYLLGRGRVSSPEKVEITEGKDEGKDLSASNILVCTGTKARTLPGLKVDGRRVLTSREALALKEMPESMIILGAGAIGVEFAYFLSTLGCEVTLLELLPRILPTEDAEISDALARSFRKRGIKSNVGARAEGFRVSEHSVEVDLIQGEKQSTFEAESILLAVGVEAHVEGLFSQEIEPELDGGFIRVDENYETSVKGIFAAGDLIGAPWLAHVATFEAIQAVNGIFGVAPPEPVILYPGCTYCQPQVASVGLTEEATKEKGIDYRVGKFPFTASGKAVAIDHSEGFVKLIIDQKYGEILGAHIIGYDATELITEYVLAMKSEIPADEIHGTIHAHPTMSEALAEAAASAYGEAIHI